MELYGTLGALFMEHYPFFIGTLEMAFGTLGPVFWNNTDCVIYTSHGHDASV